MKPCLQQRGIGDRQLGIGLVDLLVAMLISLLLLAGIGQIYISSRAANEYADNLSRLHENARFAISVLTRNIRMAGHMPCAPSTLTNALASGEFDDYLDFNRPLEGINQVEGKVDWTPAAIEGTDAIKIIYSGDSEGGSYGVVSHATGSASLELNRPNPFPKGMVLMVCDPLHGAVFQNAGVSGGPSVIHEAGSDLTPGNCISALGYPGNCSAGREYTFSEGSRLAEVKARAFYIGRNKNSNGRSLYQRRLDFIEPKDKHDPDNPGLPGKYRLISEEIVEDVENLQILYGIDSSADADITPDNYVKADAVTDWKRVVAVQLWVIASTHEPLRSFTDEAAYGSESYPLGGEENVAIPAGAEEKYRVVLSSTIQLRNRVL
ncbi:MAG: PilW family protein [Sedimenticola sp.]